MSKRRLPTTVTPPAPVKRPRNKPIQFVDLSTFADAAKVKDNEPLFFKINAITGAPTSRTTPYGPRIVLNVNLIDRNNHDFQISAWGDCAEQFYAVIKKIKTYPAILRFRSIIVKTFDASGAFKPRTFIKHSYMAVSKATEVTIEKEDVPEPPFQPKNIKHLARGFTDDILRPFDELKLAVYSDPVKGFGKLTFDATDGQYVVRVSLVPPPPFDLATDDNIQINKGKAGFKSHDTGEHVFIVQSDDTIIKLPTMVIVPGDNEINRLQKTDVGDTA